MTSSLAPWPYLRLINRVLANRPLDRSFGAEKVVDQGLRAKFIDSFSHIARRYGAASLTAAAAASTLAVLVGLQLLPPDAARLLTAWALPILGGWAAGLIFVSARALSARDRIAWMLAGGTVAAFAAGQGITAWRLLLGKPITGLGLEDVFFLGGLGLLLACLLLLPQAAQRPLERVRLMLDMTAGLIALFVLLWVTSLGALAATVSQGDARSVGDLIYAVVDGLVLAGVMVVLLRPSRYRFDPRLALAGLALVASSAVDVVNLDNGAVEPGDPLSAFWLIGFGLAALAGGIVGSPPEQLPDAAHAGTRRSGLLATYGAVLAVVGVLVYDLIVGLSSSNRAVVGVGVVLLGALTVARQSAANRENRLLAEAARNRLISSVSHELRTPLTTAVGFTELLRSRGDSLPANERAELMDLTSQALGQLSRLVSDLIMVQRGYLDPHTLTPSSVRARELADMAVAALSGSAASQVEIHVPSNLRVVTDPDRAVQLLAALLDNAFKYGQPPIWLRARPHGGKVVFEVHDAGLGVPARHQDDIWEAFERGAHRLDAQQPGSGLGLTITRAFVRALGGSIAYRRSPELGGACFEISMPQA